MSILTKASPRRRADEIHFRIIYLSTLPVFLVANLISRLVPGLRHVRSGDRSMRPSLLGEAKASAQLCGSYALMG